MKKKLLTLLLGAVALTASAETYLVYSNQTADGDQVQQIAISDGHINDMTIESMTDNTVGSFNRYTLAFSNKWGYSMYGHISNSADFDVTKLQQENMYLKFKVRTPQTNTTPWKIKLEDKYFNSEGAEASRGAIEFSLDLDNDGEWHDVSLSLKDNFAAVYNVLTTGDFLYIFSVVANDSNLYSEEGQYIDFANVRYETVDSDTDNNTGDDSSSTEATVPTTVPTPVHAAENVKSFIGSSYEAACTPAIAWWGQDTSTSQESIDGRTVYKMSKFNYQGFDGFSLDVSDMDYLHVDMWTADGTAFAFTPISLEPTAEKSWAADEVKTGEWNSYDVPLTYFTGVDFKNLKQFKFCNGDGKTYYVTNVYFWKKKTEEETARPTIIVGDITTYTNSASIPYTVTLPDALKDATVTVYLSKGDNDPEVREDNPIELTDLATYTEYTYTLKAVATLNGVDYTSEENTFTFVTESAPLALKTWYTIIDFILDSAYLSDEDAKSDTRDMLVSFPISLTYNTDKTITAKADLDANTKKIVGLDIKINDGDQIQVLTEQYGKLQYTTKTGYVEGTDPGFYLEIAHAGSNFATDIHITGYTVGMSSDEVEYGEADHIELIYNESDTKGLKIGDSFFIQGVLVDGNGHYLLTNEDDEVALEVINPSYSTDGTEADQVVLEVANHKATAMDRGEATIKATCTCDNHDYEAEATFVVFAQADSEYLNLSDKTTDGAENGSEMSWDCTSSAKHYIYYYLGETAMVIEGIHIVWDGTAYPTAYTISFTEEQKEVLKDGEVPVENETDGVAARRHVTASSSTGTYSFTNDANNESDTLSNDFLIDNGGKDTANYVTIETTEANSDSIVLKSISIQGLLSTSDAVQTGVATVAVEEDAPVEFFTLSGMRISGTPSNGIYIRRQGAKTEKIFVR